VQALALDPSGKRLIAGIGKDSSIAVIDADLGYLIRVVNF
jgi:hypothetical protein